MRKLLIKMIDIELLIFDIDGTLLDSTADIAASVNYTLRTLKLPERPAELITSYIGTGVRDLIAKSMGTGDAKRIDEGVEIFNSYYPTHITKATKLYPHVRDVLEYFKYKQMYIITNRNRNSAEVTLTAMGIRGYFKKIVGADDTNCMKPSSCPIDKLTAGLTLDKQKTMIIGDMDIDIEAGKAAGIKTCWVSYGLGKLDVKALSPDYIIDDMIELKRSIER